jgi:predicted transcriptional regulator
MSDIMGLFQDMIKDFLKNEFGKDLKEIKADLEDSKKKIDEIHQILTSITGAKITATNTTTMEMKENGRG